MITDDSGIGVHKTEEQNRARARVALGLGVEVGLGSGPARHRAIEASSVHCPSRSCLPCGRLE